MNSPAVNSAAALGLPGVRLPGASRAAAPENPAGEQARWFREEVQPHEPALRAWLHGGHPSLRDIDDIVQESYLRLIRAHAAGRIACARTYLFGIARHVALEAHRKRRLFSVVPANDLPDSPTNDARSDVAETVSHRQELALAIEAIQSLPDRCREIVTLRAVHGVSYREIASRLGLAEETIRVQMARGIKKCALYFREHGLNERDGA